MIALKLLSLEWFKSARRAVFWITTGGFAVIIGFMLGIAQYQRRERPQLDGFTLPRDWLELLRDGPVEIALVLAAVLLCLLIASESTWRTQRQNVIDGLSRQQYFAGKVLLALFVAVVFWVITLVLPLVGALFDGRPGYLDGSGPLFPRDVQLVLLGWGVQLINICAMSLMFGIIASSSGAALGLTYVFQLIQAPLLMLLLSEGGRWAEVAQRLPFSVLTQLRNPIIYDAAQLARANEAARARGAETAMLGGLEANLLALGYAALFIGIAWLAFRHRDL